MESYPYRGCFHACAYCYARPTHEYRGFGAGTDFESKLIVKINAAAKLAEALNKSSWNGELIVFSGNTDPHQPLEAEYKLTRACLQSCMTYSNPVGIISKAALLARDIDIFQELKRPLGDGSICTSHLTQMRQQGKSSPKPIQSLNGLRRWRA